VAAPPAARERNVKGAFAVRPDHRYAGRTVCLIDDIKTTGATLNECAGTLKHAGAAKVYALVLAVAGQETG
jgi:predicted amidophosphoribosyltransferase